MNRSIHRPVSVAIASAMLVILACSHSGGGGSAAVMPRVGGIRLQTVASDLEYPVYLTAPAGDARLFVVEQPGRIRVIASGKLLATPFLDLTARVGFGGERGLLSMAFHPDYAANGWFYVNYTNQ